MTPRADGSYRTLFAAPGAAAFCAALAERGVHVMPGTLFDQPHHFRMSLTATMDMIDRALPHLTEVAASLGAARR